MSIFAEYVVEPMERGILGENSGIPMGLARLSDYVGNIHQRTYYLIGGSSGTGKTAFVDFCYVLYPCIWYWNNKDKSDIKLSIIYRSMERSMAFKIQKWTCYYVYLKSKGKTVIDVPTINGWVNKKCDIDHKLKSQIMEAQKFIDWIFSDVVIMFDGPENPTGIYKHMREYALKHGSIVKTWIDKEANLYNTKYIPDNPKHYMLCIQDHLGKLVRESRSGVMLSKKENIDKMSEYNGIMRDRYGFIPVAINQFNRNLGNIQRMRTKDLGPEPDDFKESGNIYEDSDVVFGLYNPYKLKDYDHLGYDVRKFKDISLKGENRFRSVTVLKNTFGSDDIAMGLLFLGECGYLNSLPRPDDSAELAKTYSLIKSLSTK